MYRNSTLDTRRAHEVNEAVEINGISWSQSDDINEGGQMFRRYITMKNQRCDVYRDGYDERKAFWISLDVQAVRVEQREIGESIIDPRADLRAAGMSDMQIWAFEAKHDIDLSPKVEKIVEHEIMYGVTYRHGEETYRGSRSPGYRHCKKLMTLEDAMKFCDKFMKRYSAIRKAA